MPTLAPLRTGDPDHVGRYRVIRRIAGMPGAGPVYLVSQTAGTGAGTSGAGEAGGGTRGTSAALQLLQGTWTRDSAARDRFAAEAGSARRVPPFCAARILDAGLDGDFAYLVREYVAGSSLLETVADHGELNGPELVALAIGSATGLASVHQAGLVHGSFGPEYVIMSAAGPRIIEFGITPPYGQATPAADMLAWAQTVVFAALGRPPGTLADLDALPAPLRPVIAGCLAGNPNRRPAARSVVLSLLGDAAPAAGPLAEGSRRAAQGAQAARAARAAQTARAVRPARGDARPQARASRPGGGADVSGNGPGDRIGPAGEKGLAGKNGPAGENGPGGENGPAGVNAPASGSSQDARVKRRRRDGLLPAAAAIMVLAIAGVLIAVVLHRAGTPGRPAGDAGSASAPAAGGGTGSTTGTSTGPASSSTSAGASLPATAATVPAGLIGSWAGQARQADPGDVFSVRVRIAGGVAGSRVTYSGSSFSCAGHLTLRSSHHGTLTLSQRIVTNRSTCTNGVVTLSVGAAGTLRFSFRGRGGPTAAGTLTRD